MPDETNQPEVKQQPDAVVADPPAAEVKTPVVAATPDPAKPDPAKVVPPAPVGAEPPGVSEDLTAAPPVVAARPDPLKPVPPVTPVTPEVTAHQDGEAPVPEIKDEKAAPAAPSTTATQGSATSTAPKLPGAETPAAPNAAAPEGEEDPNLNSKFMSNKAMGDLLKHLGKDNLAQELMDVLARSDMGETHFDKDKDGHALLTLGVNQHVIDFGKLPDGRDFIGLGAQHSNAFDEHDARALVGLAKSNKWNSITVHGNDDQKGALWLEAQRQGVPVKGFEPAKGSPVWKQWHEVDEPKMRKQQEAEAAAATGGARIAPVVDTPVMAISEGAPVVATPASSAPPPVKATVTPKRAAGPGGP